MSELLITESLKTKGFIIVPIKGTSMNPLFYEKRDKVYIEKYDGNYALKKGDVVLYQRESCEYVLHRLIKTVNGAYVFCGDNHYILEYGVQDSQILGVCTGYFKYDKYIDFKKSLKYKIYKNTYAKSFFIRKLYNKIKRIFTKK